MKVDCEQKEKIESMLAEFPICQYGILKSEETIFTEKVRTICQMECPRYGKSWSCPPAVGSVLECQKNAYSYKYVLVFTTLAEVSNIHDMQETLATRSEHEQIVHAICERFSKMEISYFALASESCAICKECAYPKKCWFPSRMLPCIESQGILVTDVAEKCGIEYFYDSHTVNWYGMIFFYRREEQR